MSKKDVFATIKEVNIIVDRMKNLDTDSREYEDLSDSLYWMLESLTYGNRYQNYSLHLSKRTGHYYVKYA